MNAVTCPASSPRTASSGAPGNAARNARACWT
jgi:hypothetical protein